MIWKVLLFETHFILRKIKLTSCEKHFFRSSFSLFTASLKIHCPVWRQLSSWSSILCCITALSLNSIKTSQSSLQKHWALVQCQVKSLAPVLLGASWQLSDWRVALAYRLWLFRLRVKDFCCTADPGPTLSVTQTHRISFSAGNPPSTKAHHQVFPEESVSLVEH